MADTISNLALADLLQQLEQLKDTLQENGVVVRRTEQDRRSGWRLRFRRAGEDGRRHQRSIALADETIADAVRRLIASWQDQHRQRRDAQRQARQAQEQAVKDEVAKRRQRRRRIQDLAGGGRRRRQRIGQLFDKAAAQGWRAEMDFCLGEPYKRPNRRPGRPPKGRLVMPPLLSV